MRRTLQQLIAGLLATAPLLASCGGDDVTAPPAASLVITTATSGPEPDTDGYTVSVDGGAEIPVGSNATYRDESIEPGSHSVLLGGLSANCTVMGENPRTVSVEAGATASVTFALTCEATTGSLSISTTTTGVSPDPDGYRVTVDGVDRGAVIATGAFSLESVPRGDHLVGLNGVSGNCQVQGDNPRTVTVPPGASASLAFEVSCTAPPTNAGSILIVTNTTGADPDPDGYVFALDGGATQPIGAGATVTLTNVAPGSHNVGLSGLASNCEVQGANPRSVTVSGGATSQVGFEVTCSAANGTLEIATTTTGDSPDPDGYTVTLDGGVAQPIGTSATVTISNISAGPHQVTLGGIAGNCTAAGENPRTVSITAGSKSTIKFDITCQSPQASAGKIAFLRENLPEDERQDLYVMNPDGTGVQRLTVGSDVLRFDWAPDGSRIVFESFRDKEIYAINADGTGLVNLTNTPSTWERKPDWSADGSRIAFLQGDDIYVMNSDGAAVRKLVNGAQWWAWSPDGQRIVFLGQENLGRQRDHYVINVDGTAERNLTNTPQDHKQDAPSWSPDGQWISYIASPFGETWPELYAVRVDGSNQRRLTNDPGGEGDHYWSPDSRRIAYNTDRDRGDRRDSREIYIMNSDGSGQTNLTNTPGEDPDPSKNDERLRDWSPDGSKILYSRMRRIWVMNSDGTAQTDLNQQGIDPDWSPR